MSKLKVAILQNMTVCTYNTEDYKLSIVNTTKALEIDENAVKARYLRCVAYQKQGDLDSAMADIK